jgi:hypothetical protein
MEVKKMIPKSRITMASFIAGVAGGVVAGLISYVFISAGDIGIPEYTMAIGVVSGFLACFLVSAWYLKFMADKSWQMGILFGPLFGALAGGIAGMVTGFSSTLEDVGRHNFVLWQALLVGGGAGLGVGAWAGGITGLLSSLTLGPILARFPERTGFADKPVSEEYTAKTGKPTIAGVLNITAGSLIITVAVFIFTGFSIEFGAWSIPRMGGVISFWPPAMVVGIGTIILLVAVLAVLGGVFALRRKHWGWALAGSVAAIFLSYVTIWFTLPAIGILAIILLGLSKKEFE